MSLKKDDFIMIFLGIIILLVAYLIFTAPNQAPLPPSTTQAPATLGSTAGTAASATGGIPSPFADKLAAGGGSTTGGAPPDQAPQGTSGKQLFKAPPPPEKSQASYYDEVQKAIVAFEKDSNFNLTPAQCTQILNLIKKVEDARNVAPATQKAILSALTPEQTLALNKVKAPAQGGKGLEALVAEVLASLKAKL